MRLFRRIAAASVSLLVLISCGKDSAHLTRRGGGGIVPLSAKEYDFFKALNQSNTDIQDAIHIAFPKTAELTSAPSDKAHAMAKEIIDTVCKAETWEAPGTDFKTGWGPVEQSVKGDDKCALEQVHRESYSLSPSYWAFDTTFSNRTQEAVDPGQISGYTLDGYVEVREPGINSATIFLDGEVDITPLTVSGTGNLTVHMTISHSLYGNKRNSLVMAAITFPGYWQHVLSVQGNNDTTEKSYFVDNLRYSRKEFDELFSFLQMDKILDKSKDMR